MSQRKRITNPLRASPSPFIKREVKREHQQNKQIPRVKNEQQQRAIPASTTPEWKEYDLKACTAEEIQDIRTHVLKFQSKHTIVPKDFSQPIRLHRKETKNLQYQLTRAEIEQRQKEYAELVALETAQREKRLAAKAEREKNMDPSLKKLDISLDPTVAPEPVKTEEQKLLEKKEKLQQHIAPDGGARKNLNPQKPKKTRQLRALDENAKKLRYEEYYPWVMEDYDGKNTWVGSYEAGNSDQYALLVLGDDGNFKLLPADKVYRFTPRNKYNTLTLAEAEKRMSRNNQTPRWFMKHLDEREQKLTRYERTQRKLKTVVGTQEGDRGERDSDNDDLDFEEDFADDEENPIVDGEEQDVKDSERKIKREQRQANAMGLREYEMLDDDEEEDLFGERKVDKSGKKIRKALLHSSNDGQYDSDDDEENPYLSAGDLDIDDDDDEDEEYVKKEEEKESNDVVPKASSRLQSPTISKIKVKSHNQGYITFKALPAVLKNFPAGSWNPRLKKRQIEEPTEEEPEAKRVKTEASEETEAAASFADLPSVIQIEEGGAAARVDPNLLTEQDLIDIVTTEKTTAKQLIHKLKNKLNAHPDNKALIKSLVKKVLKNQDGYLVLKKL
ncbi:hypothetical protein WICPIJ_009861 [Wickerhamomyces pijperi]|uniref:Transcription initiation factor IIF subunit alpha n=1 Tax=Wickerhamomyces pijperi TaxID=599730 RepID=A0A9P8PKY0_WICPI|nr:hypothetical protein WICPIJ_009861 [Wickerhamomyces pijperi]